MEKISEYSKEDITYLGITAASEYDHKTTHLINYIELLEPVLKNESDDSAKPEITKEELNEKINQMIAYADTFDIDGLDIIVKELSYFHLPLDFSQKFVKIAQYVQNVDFKELRNLLLEWSNEE